MDAIYLATKAQIENARTTAVSPRTAVKVGFRSFFWEGDTLHVMAWFGRSGYALECTMEQAVALSRNHAHVRGASTGRNRKRLEIVMGSGT
jgi:hypothetical protein